MAAVTGSVFSVAHTSTPDRTGIFPSRMIRSGSNARASASACSPSYVTTV